MPLLPCSWQHVLPESHTRVVGGVVVVAGVGIFALWLHRSLYRSIHRSICPPPPKLCGSPDGPVITSSRIKLNDGRYIAYKETGVIPHETARYKVIYVHGFKGSRLQVPDFPQDFLQMHGIHVLSFDRAGYGQSDPNPGRGLESEARDIEQIADGLGFGDTFYLLAESIGGYSGWSCLKYIPNRLAGVGMVAPATNFWWKCVGKDEFKKAFGTQTLLDRVFLRVVHYLPSLTYLFLSHPWIPKTNGLILRPEVLNASDREVLQAMSKWAPEKLAEFGEGVKQGIGESLCRDITTMFGEWAFDPSKIENPFSSRPGHVHIWQGDEDYLVPVTLQRIVHKHLPWIHYHELKGEGHFVSPREGFPEYCLRALLELDFQQSPVSVAS